MQVIDTVKANEFERALMRLIRTAVMSNDSEKLEKAKQNLRDLYIEANQEEV